MTTEKKILDICSKKGNTDSMVSISKKDLIETLKALDGAKKTLQKAIEK